MGGKLSARRVDTLTRPGRYGDGGGLWLQISANGGKSWALRYQLRGRPRQMGLGPVELVSLAKARELARAHRQLLLEGVDPIDHRSAQRKAPAPMARTFRAAAESYIAAHEAGWRSTKHAGQWTATLTTYVYPELAELPVAAVDTEHVLSVLRPIWSRRPETASRVRGRIEAILSAAKVAGHRTGDNPARWRGHLDQVLPARRKVRAVKHHPALPYAEMPAFMAELRRRAGTAARALEFAVLCAARSGEVRGATVAESTAPPPSGRSPASA